jgi:foldase protein PrsA
MMRRSAAGLCAAAGVLGVFLLAGCGGSSGSSSQVPAGAVAVVDGTPITVGDLTTTMHIAQLAMKSSYPVPGTTDWIALRQRALEALAHDAELRAWAHNLGVTVAPKAVDDAVQQTLASAFPGTATGTIDQAKVDAEFRSTGMTQALLRHRIETKLLAQAAADKVGGNPTVTDAQVLAQYNKDKATTYTLPERREVRHILVKDEALASQLSSQLSSSDADFAALAKQYSIDPGSKAKGGDLGLIQRTGVVKPFGDAAFTLPEGVVSKPVKSQYGWHIIEATGPILPKGPQPLDKALKAQIRTQLAEQQRQKQIARQFDLAVIDLSKDIQFAPGYAPAVAAQQ